MLFDKKKKDWAMAICSLFLWVFFFFQAEDGIRDRTVTGVRTCALPFFVFFFFLVVDIFIQMSGFKFFRVELQ